MMFVAHLYQKLVCGHLGNGINDYVRLLGQIILCFGEISFR